MIINYHLRPATPVDAPALQESCWPDRSVDAVRELLKRAEGIARRRRGLGIVAETIGDSNGSGKRLLAYGQLTLWPRTSEISDLIVMEAMRGNGIGSTIIAYFIKQARDWSQSSVEIGAALSNPRALALYRRLGFKDDRTITLDIGSGLEPIIYLVMELNPQ